MSPASAGPGENDAAAQQNRNRARIAAAREANGTPAPITADRRGELAPTPPPRYAQRKETVQVQGDLL